MKKLGFVTTVFLSISSLTAVAQEAILEEIVVTAQKRQGIAQEIPMALTVLSEDYLQKQQIQELQDLRDVVAGLEVIGTQPSNNRIGMRGIISLGGPISPIGYYIDETPIASWGSESPDVAMFDVQRVEVLRGPQGTLYGDGSLGGTIRVITNKPDTGKFSGRFQARGYSYEDSNDGFELKGLVNVPVSDTFALRASVAYHDDDGFIDNRDVSVDGDNWYEKTSVRLIGRWLPTDRTTVDLAYSSYDLDMGRVSEQTSVGVFDPANALPSGFHIPASAPSTRSFEYDLYNITLNHEFDNFQLVSATSYYDKDSSQFRDLNLFIAGFFFGAPIADFLPGSFASDQTQSNRDKTLTQEIRLVSNGDEKFDWNVGVFFRDFERSIVGGLDMHVNLDLGLFDPMDAGIVVPVVDEFGIDQQDSSYQAWAVFTEIDYEFAPDFNLIAGLRYYENDRDSLVTQLTDSAVFDLTAGTMIPGSGEDDSLSPKLAVYWKPSDKTTLFASASKGFRSGGTNAAHFTDPMDVPREYKSETVWAYEVGVKATPSDRLLSNFYLYHNDWEDMRLSFTTEDGLFNYRDNAGTAEATGAELELRYLATDNLSLELSASYIDASIGATVIAPDGDIAAQEGNEIPYVGPFTLNIGADYSRPIGGNAIFKATGNYAYKDSTFSDPENSTNQRNDSYEMLNGRLGVEWDTWSIYLFGRNLTDVDATTTKSQPIGALDDFVFSIYVPPRQLGLQLEAVFD